MVEHNVALIVGCMPGFAGFIKTRVGSSQVYKSFRSRLSGTTYFSNGSNRSRATKPSLPGPPEWSVRPHGKQTDGRGAGAGPYYEMHDSTAYPETQIVGQYESNDGAGSRRQLVGDEERGILKTTDVAVDHEEPHAR